jgi:hypothetical protein
MDTAHHLPSVKESSACYMLGLFFNPKDGGNMLLKMSAAFQWNM